MYPGFSEAKLAVPADSIPGEDRDITSRKSQCPCSGGPRVDHDLSDVLFFIPPDLVKFRSSVETDAVRDDVARIDLTFLDSREQRLHIVMHVGLPHLHGDTLTESSPERTFIWAP